MAGSKSKSNVPPLADPLETGREFVRSLKKPAKKWVADEASENGKTFMEQLLGMDLHSKGHKAEHPETPAEKSTTITGVELIDIFVSNSATSEKHNAKAEKKTHAEAGMNYSREIVESGKRTSKAEHHEMRRNIEEIKAELKKLVSSSQILKAEFTEVAVEESPKEVGTYHVNFFEWMLAVIRTAREKVEDSGAWLTTVKGKGAKKGYWGMFKKHGTSFGLSGERSVATQVG